MCSQGDAIFRLSLLKIQPASPDVKSQLPSPQKGITQSQDSPQFSQEIISHPRSVSGSQLLSFALWNSFGRSNRRHDMGQDVASDHGLCSRQPLAARGWACQSRKGPFRGRGEGRHIFLVYVCMCIRMCVSVYQCACALHACVCMCVHSVGKHQT